ncbi:hypothetical protein [Spongiactinospora sp. TRM90649]|uniref:hypothetical protein n=1 Tax=Spongiactinospora sp. TRM90649 TaxID=3031114 RepID=UPI0023F79F8F|nr:hypothetical protein [Spongiactinospora sp. TRM90649]MDF5755013.1 hypothetical protein [Spongiactinospora sp. TRM90649]
MEFWKTIYDLARRKFVGPPVILLSIVMAAIVYILVPATYVSSTSMVLTTPPAGGTLTSDPERQGGLTNPLLQFSDGLRTTTGVLILSMNTPEMMAALGITENSGTEIIINDGRTNPELLGISMSGPFIYIETTSGSAQAAKDVTARAQRRIRQELDDRQRALGAPRSTYISIVDVVPPTLPKASLSDKIQFAGGALVACVSLGFGIAYALRRRKILSDQAAAPPATAAFAAAHVGAPPGSRAIAPGAGAVPKKPAKPAAEPKAVAGPPAKSPAKPPAKAPAQPPKAPAKKDAKAEEPKDRPEDEQSPKDAGGWPKEGLGKSVVVMFPATGGQDDDTVAFARLPLDETGPIPAVNNENHTRYEHGKD